MLSKPNPLQAEQMSSSTAIVKNGPRDWIVYHTIPERKQKKKQYSFTSCFMLNAPHVNINYYYFSKLGY